MTTDPFDTAYFSSDHLRAFPFKRVGERVRVARNCTIVGLENITLDDDVRIDANTSLIVQRGYLTVGRHVHIGIGCVLGARGGIELGDYSSLSHGVRILSALDDYSGRWMTNSTLPEAVLGVHEAPVVVGRHVPVGTGSLIVGGVTIDEGAAVGALSLVDRPLQAWRVYGGNPLQELGERRRDILERERLL